MNRSIFSIDSRSDINFLLRDIPNLRDKVLEPRRRTILFILDHDELRNVKNVVNSTYVISDNRNVIMASYIARNLNITTIQVIQRKIADRFQFIKYGPKPTNKSNYAEMFMSSMDYYIRNKEL